MNQLLIRGDQKLLNQLLKQDWQEVADLDSEEAEKDTVSQMARDAEEHGEHVTKVILQCMLNPDGESCVTGEIFTEDLVREVADISDGDYDTEKGEESEEEKVPGL